MNTRDQFGNYLLLKKLSEDALGESFRAGRLGKQGVERVVLLRVFNGQGLDGERLAQRIAARAPLQQALRSPNLGQGIDQGQVRGVPYVAYDYVSGKSLGQLLEQAAKKNSPIPLDHALLIAERIALGLAVAYETRVGDERVQHGFLAPQLVLVSNEGEIRLLGFEASIGLREFAGHPLIKQSAGRYLAPEVLTGAAPAKADDVYSLGALLFELLTGKPLPIASSGQAAAVDQAIVAADGGNLHPELANLLKRSLAPREQRIGDAVTWHKTLAKLMFDGQYNPTTFNLAFFMHNLFREEIERETQEMELEKTTAIPVPAPAAAAPAAARPAAPAAAAPQREPGPVREDTSVFRDRYGMEGKPAGGGKKNLLLVAGLAGVAVLAVVGYLLFGRGGSSAAPAASTPPETAAAAAPAPSQPAGPTPEEIQAQIAKMVSDQSKQLEAGLKAQYDEQMKALQKQLEDAKKSQAQLATAPPPAARPAETPAPAPVEAKPAPLPAAETKPPVPEAKPVETKPAVPEPKAAEPAPAPAAPASVRVGDLVTMGPGVVPPKMTRRGTFRYPPMAQRMRKEAQITVKVLIDETGRVVDAQNAGDKVGFGMDEAAIDYARSCGYSPATKNGVAVKMWLDLKVSFSLGS